ncbi:hypothetical protein [Photobacterium kasasachensis]|uniref:hypothetical protein n=1 Tax=Photobacterium kasasachensis TaxID=2910240 RepID=UPI003D144026
MHTVTFYPVGNGDTSLITLTNGKHILMDYRQHGNATDNDKPEYDIAKDLKKVLKDAKKNSFEVVAFTHADEDHIERSTEFFYFEHIKKYQGSDRIKIDELWVPAAMLLESVTKDKLDSEFVTWRTEARERLKSKKGIKVFSKPEDLVKLIESWDMTVDELSEHIIDAGTIVDTFSLKKDGVEFFVHSPFMKHCSESGKDIKKVRNEAALMFNVRFKEGEQLFDYLAVGDSSAEVLEDIVEITKNKGREDRLKWDLFNIPHHCSYLALAYKGDKGEEETIPVAKVKELLLMGNEDAYLICSSKAFEKEKDALERDQPPHLQAKRCYERYLRKVKGRKLFVTMENGGKKKPEPITIEFSKSGMSKKALVATAALATAATTPARAG